MAQSGAAQRHPDDVKQLERAGYFAEHNGISHRLLTAPAYDRLTALLLSYGNELSDNHKLALMALVGLMTKMAQGQLQGRWAFALPTGMGKTTAIIAWVATLADLDADHVSVAVSASKVEALCQLKRDLIAEGVPPDAIGLIHSYNHDPNWDATKGPMRDGFASEPSTNEVDRQIMLITHARVRTGDKLPQFSQHKGKPRDLLLYDESLITSDSIGLALWDLKGALGFLERKYEASDKHQPAIAFLRSCLAVIEERLAGVKTGHNPATGIITLPSLDFAHRSHLKSLLGRSQVMQPAVTLLELGDEPVRIVPTANGGVVSYTVSVPPELQNIIILDASHPVRRLIQLDSSIHDAEKELADVKRIGVPLSALKRFDQLTVHQMFAGGGRSTMAEDFANPYASDRKTIKEIIEVVRQVPADEAVLVFVYKDRDGIDFPKVLANDMAKAGLDVHGTVTVKVGDKQAPHPRINIATWGNESSTNVYAYCRHVILAGILQRSPVDLAGAYLGQTGDLSGDIAHSEIAALLNSECAHVAYQAMSRGTCRVIDGSGSALAMQCYLIHRDLGIRVELSKVLPGAEWRIWEPKYGDPSKGITAKTTARIVDYLAAVPPEITKVSIQELKRACGLVDVSTGAFQPARDAALKVAPWVLEGRSLVRLFPSDPIVAASPN